MKNIRGYTLVEVLIASALGVIILAAALALLSAGQRCFLTGVAFANIHSDARTASDRIARDVRWATQVFTGSATNTLVLEIPSIDANGDIIEAVPTPYDYVTYELNPADNTQLQRVVAADPASSRVNETRIIADNVSNLTFSSDGIPLAEVGALLDVRDVSIDITIARNMIGGWTLDEQHRTGAFLRNKI